MFIEGYGRAGEDAMVTIEKAEEITLELLATMLRLVPQLHSSNPPPTPDELEALLRSESSTLFLARAVPSGEIVGMATLVLYRVPTGLRGYIEDVVVDEAARGQGTGRALTRACLEAAKKAGAPQVGLTSHPGRTAANRLYQMMGFELRQTNAYRYVFKKGRW
jgi:ribosomal protein S18 acetylase RimI-like enzyme